MPDVPSKSTDAQADAQAEQIKWEENAQHGPRGNVHSEPDEVVVKQDLPPPQPS